MRIGIDLGGTNTVVCLCDEGGLLIDKLRRPTCFGNSAQMKLDMLEMASDLCQKHKVPVEEISQIGLGVPGSVDKSNSALLFGTNLGMNHVSFRDAFEPTFTCPIKIENDANCAALGEVIAGAGGGSQSAVMVTLGTGVGGGIILDGKIYTGFNDAAGEIGHMVVVAGGWQCNCGRKGCLESYASATGMIRLANAALEQDTSSVLTNMAQENDGKLTAKMICDANDMADPLAMHVFEQYCMYLACGLVNLVNILQPEKIIIGGGVAGYGEKLLAPIRSIVAREGFKGIHGSTTQVVLARLGNDAGLIGAAMLV